jgi:DNA-directed RNA polymerase subunit M/transcription elongation factor TFIIS
MANGIYQSKFADLIFNLANENQTMDKIITDIHNKCYNPYNLAFCTAYELNMDQWLKIIMRKNKTKEVLSNLPTIDYIPCIKCACTKYNYIMLQIRGADEATTIFYICTQCGNTTSENN